MAVTTDKTMLTALAYFTREFEAKQWHAGAAIAVVGAATQVLRDGNPLTPEIQTTVQAANDDAYNMALTFNAANTVLAAIRALNA